MRLGSALNLLVVLCLLGGCQTTTTAAPAEMQVLPDARAALATVDAATGQADLDASAQASDAGSSTGPDGASSADAASAQSYDGASAEPLDAARADRDAEASASDASIALAACAVIAPAACPTPMPHYADVEPIFKQRCVVCHSPMWTGPWPLDQYQHVSDWQVDIRADLLDCSMPPPDAGVALPLAERTAILTWIRCGLPQ